MLQQAISMMPKDVGTAGLVCALAGTAVGLLLWLVGARLSRPMITLLTVLGGGMLGMMLPRWLDWQISGAGLAVGGALVFGLTGFLLHRFWVGFGLGVVLTLWTAVGVWLVMQDGVVWSMPTIDPGQITLAQMSREIWASLPQEVTKVLPTACAVAMVSGLVAGMLWPRIGVVLMYSSAGASMLVWMGMAALEYGRPQWLVHVPATLPTQLLIFFGLVAFGAVFQWQLAPSVASGNDDGGGDESEEGD